MKRQEVTRSRRWKSDHGFKRGQALYLDDDGVLQLACADTEQRARCVGVVDDYITRDSFILSGPGTILENLEDLTTGQVYYLDPVTPGALTTTAPDENRVEVFQATSDRTASVLLRTMTAGTGESSEGSEPIAVAHISENHEAHDASAIAVVPVGDLEADNVQDALGELDEDLTAHIEDTADAHAASAITNTPAGSIAATDVQSAINELDGDVTAVAADLAAHLADTTDAHAASAITNTPAGNIAATTVQAALNELDSEKATTGSVAAVASDLAAHLADTTDAHDASAISNVPAGNIAATDVQGAINELDSEKASTGSVSAVAADLAAHIADTTDAHAASAITNTPAGSVAATTVQGAINELDTEKIATSVLDTDGALAANSDAKVATQKATKTYADTKIATASIGSVVQAWDADLDVWATKTAPSGTVVGTSDTQTLTNKRVTLRTVTLTDAATVTPNCDTTDVGILTSLSQTTVFANPTGTPTDNQLLELRVYDASARAISFGNQYRETETTLPSTTTAGKTLRMLLQWHGVDSKWDILAKATTV